MTNVAVAALKVGNDPAGSYSAKSSMQSGETGEFTQLLSDSGGEGNATERETDAESLDGKPGGALTGQASARSLSKLMDPTATRSTFRAEGTASSQTAAASQTASAGAEAPALTATPSAAAGPATTTVQQAMTALPAEPTISPDAPGNVGTMTPDGAANQPIGTKTQQVVTPEGALSSLPGGAEETSLLDLVSAAVGAAPKRPNALPAAEAKSDASRANGDGDGSDDGSLDTDGLSSTSALTVLAALSGETVAQQGGVAAADEEAIVGSKADVLTTAVPQAQLGLPTDDTAPDAASAPVCEGEQAPETASFRLQKAGDAAAALSLSIVRGEDGHAEVLDDVSATGKIETVTVLDARRYLGFGMSLNSSALVAAASNDREWAAALQPSSALAGATSVSSTGNVVNTLKLELSPEHLGTVTANMRLVGDQLSIHLTVHNAAAYRELNDDSKPMLDALRAQGFSVDQVTVSMAPAADGASNGSNDQNSQGSNNAQTQQQFAKDGDATRQQAQGQGRSSSEGDQDGAARRGGPAVEAGTTGGTGSGDLYL